MSRAKLIARCKDDLLSIYNHAIESVKPEKLVKKTIKIQNNVLTVKNSQNDGTDINLDLSRNNVHLIGGGKSVLAMASGLAQLVVDSGYSHLFSHGCLSIPIGLKPKFETDSKNRSLMNALGVKCRFGSKNNLPDQDSIESSKSILRQVSAACDRDRAEDRDPLFLVLISGGGSACLTDPRYISLEHKLQLINFLVQKGADIVELNKVRRYFSNIKGGQLAAHILGSHPRSRVLSLILSDVIGDQIEFIASGPTCLNQGQAEHRQAMLDVLHKYNYPLDNIIDKLGDFEATIDVGGRVVMNLVIGNNKVALRASTKAAEELGYKVGCLGNDLQGLSQDIVHNLVKASDALIESSQERKVLIIGGGEAVINKLEGETWGVGGRAQEMALDYMLLRMQEKTGRKGQALIDVFLAGGTDGQDGPTDVAGCLASLAEYNTEEGTFKLKDAINAKRSHDSFNFWTEHKPNWLIKTGLTGTNVMDLYYLLVSEE